MKDLITVLGIIIFINFVVGIIALAIEKLRNNEFKAKFIEGISISLVPGCTYYRTANKDEVILLEKMKVHHPLVYFIPIVNLLVIYICLKNKDRLFLEYLDAIDEVSQ